MSPIAVLKYKKRKKNASGEYDILHYETDSSVVYRSDNTTTVEESLTSLENDKLNKSGDTMTGNLKMNGSCGISARHLDGNNTDFEGDLFLNYGNQSAKVYVCGTNEALHSGNYRDYALDKTSVTISAGTDVLGLAPGYYNVENLASADVATAMNLPEYVWHYEIVVMGTTREAKSTECYKTIIVQCGTNRRHIRFLHWTDWSPWRRMCGIDSSGNLDIDTDFILPHGMTVNGWSNFEQIRCKNYGNPFECSQYIDFHAVGSDVDYTTRLYADGTGLLRMDPRPDPGAMSLRMSYATSSDPGAGSSLTSGDMVFVYE